MEGKFVLRNAEGMYLCSSDDSMSRVWRHASDTRRLLYYISQAWAESVISESATSHETVRVGGTEMIGPSYPDMSTAYAEAV
jgi:hypothetical protein